MRRKQNKYYLAALRRKNELFCGVNQWGLVGVALALLFCFMIGKAATPHGSVVADLAKVSHSTPLPGALREDAIRVVLTRDSRVYFRNQLVTLEDLPDEIRKQVQNGAEKKVYVSADARAKYGDVSRVLAEIRLAGIGNVAFRTETLQR